MLQRNIPNLHRTYKIANRQKVQAESRGLFFQSCSVELILGNLIPISHQAAVTDEVRIRPFPESDVKSERIVGLRVTRGGGGVEEIYIYNIFH